MICSYILLYLFYVLLLLLLHTYLCQLIDMDRRYHPTLCIGKMHCHCVWKNQQKAQNECGRQDAVQMVNQRHNHQCLTPAKQQAKQQLPEQCTPLTTADALKLTLQHIRISGYTNSKYILGRLSTSLLLPFDTARNQYYHCQCWLWQWQEHHHNLGSQHLLPAENTEANYVCIYVISFSCTQQCVDKLIMAISLIGYVKQVHAQLHHEAKLNREWLRIDNG